MDPNNVTDWRTLFTKKRVAIGVAIVALLLMIWFVLNIINSGYVEITSRSDIGQGKTTSVEIVLPPGQKPLELTLKAGEVKKVGLKKGEYRINSSSGNLKSVDVVAVRGLKTAQITVPKGEQHAIRKLGSDAQFCPLVVGGQTYSYNCYGDGSIYQHNPLDSNKLDARTVMFNNASFSSLQRVQDGLLGLRASEDTNASVLVYVKPASNSIQEIAVPAAVSGLLETERPNIVVSPDPDKSHFLMVFARKRAVYLFRSVQDANPIRLALPQNAAIANEFGIATYSFYNDRIVSYAGKTDAIEDGLEGFEDSKAPTSDYDNRIYEYDFDGKLVGTIDLPKDFSASGISKITDSFYAAQQNDGLELYHRQGDNFRMMYRLDEGDQPLTLGKTTYAIADSTLYAFRGHDDGSFTLESLFSSPDVSVSDVFATPDGLLFTAYTKRSSSPPVDVYQLLDTKQTIPPLEEALSLSKLGNIITSYDYDNVRIIFTLDSTGTADYETLRSRLEAKLKQMGINVGDRKVELYPLN